MPGPANTLLIEGSFSELSEELAQYIDAVSKTEPASGVAAEIAPLVNAIRDQEQSDNSDLASVQEQKDEVLKAMVGKATVLNSVPEKGTLRKPL